MLKSFKRKFVCLKIKIMYTIASVTELRYIIWEREKLQEDKFAGGD